MSEGSWYPSERTRGVAQEFVKEFLGRMPALLGIDEIITGCELIALDPFGVGVGTIPRYVTVKLREFNQQVWYTGTLGLTVGDDYAVVHVKDGDRYEILGASGTGGASGGAWIPPPNLVLGTGAATQVAYWSAVDTIAGDAGFTYNPATDTMTVGAIEILTGGDIDPADASGQDLGDLTHRWDLYTQEVIFGGASGANIITVPGSVADALRIVDGNAVEYLRLDTDPQLAVIWNEGGADIDHRWEAVGVADALQVRGSDGQITLGVLTAGYVKSNAGGVLSVATEVPLIDLGSYTQGDLIYGGAADWQDLAVGGAYDILGVNVGGNEPEWQTFDWDLHIIAAGGDGVHSHANAGEGGQLDWDLVWSDAVHDHSAAGEGGEIPLASLGSYTRGDLIVGGLADWTDLPLGASCTVLHSDGTDVEWSTLVSLGLVTGTGAANRIAYWSGVNALTSDAGLLVDAANDMFIVADAGGIGNAVTTARLMFDSSGATDYAYFLGCNVGIGTGSPPSVFAVHGDPTLDGDLDHVVTVRNSADAYSTSPKVGIQFVNLYNAAGDPAGMGGIQVGKENAIDGQYGSYLSLHTRTHGSAVAEHVRITSADYTGFGTPAPDRLTHAEVSDAIVNAITYAQRLSHISSGTVVTGFGTGIEFELEENDGSYQVAGIIECLWHDAGEVDSRQSYFNFKTQQGDPAASSVMVVGYLGRVGVAVGVPLGMLHVDQYGTLAGIPVLTLDQADISEGFINFIGSDRGVITGATNSVVSVRVELGGVKYRLALYANA